VTSLYKMNDNDYQRRYDRKIDAILSGVSFRPGEKQIYRNTPIRIDYFHFFYKTYLLYQITSCFSCFFSNGIYIFFLCTCRSLTKRMHTWSNTDYTSIVFVSNVLRIIIWRRKTKNNDRHSYSLISIREGYLYWFENKSECIVSMFLASINCFVSKYNNALSYLC